jgi:hypothetical protein
MLRTIVSKGDYARMKERTPAAVSIWIRDGKISRAGLVGEGNAAKIWVEQADADLTRNLDPAQQAAQAHPVGLVPAPAPLAAPAPVPAPALPPSAAPIAPPLASGDDDLARRRRAEAERAEMEVEQTRRRMAADDGRWVEAAAAAKEWGRALTKIINDTETFVGSTLAREIADKFGLDWKALSVACRESYRQHRVAVAQEALAELAQLAGEPTAQ